MYNLNTSLSNNINLYDKYHLASPKYNQYRSHAELPPYYSQTQFLSQFDYAKRQIDKLKDQNILLQRKFQQERDKNSQLLQIKRKLQQQVLKLEFSLSNIGSHGNLIQRQFHIRFQNISNDYQRASKILQETIQELQRTKKQYFNVLNQNCELKKTQQTFFNTMKKDDRNKFQRSIIDQLKNFSQHEDILKKNNDNYQNISNKKQNNQISQETIQYLLNNVDKNQIHSNPLLTGILNQQCSNPQNTINKIIPTFNNQQNSFNLKHIAQSYKHYQNSNENCSKQLIKNVLNEQNKKNQFKKNKPTVEYSFDVSSRNVETLIHLSKIRQSTVKELLQKHYKNSIEKAKKHHSNSIKIFIKSISMNLSNYEQLSIIYLEGKQNFQRQVGTKIIEKIITNDQIGSLFNKAKFDYKKTNTKQSAYLALFRYLTILQKMHGNHKLLETIEHNVMKVLYEMSKVQ